MLPRIWWWQEAAETFWGYYLAADLGLLVFLLFFLRNEVKLLRRTFLALLIGGAVALAGLHLLNRDIIRHRAGGIGSFSLSVSENIEDAEGTQADVRIIFQDRSETRESEIVPYIYSRSGSDSVRLYSRYPADPDPLVTLGDDVPSSLIVRLHAPAGPVIVGALRLFPTAGEREVTMNNVIIRRFGTRIRFSEEPVIVAAVMNTVPATHVFRVFERVSRTHLLTWRPVSGPGSFLRLLFLPHENLHVFAKNHAFFETEGRECEASGCRVWGAVYQPIMQ